MNASKKENALSLRIRIPLVAAATSLALLWPVGAASATGLACTLDLDTGSLTCGSAPAPRASTYLLATLYTAANYGGSSLALKASTPCDTNADVDHQWGSLPAGFADEVSSFTGANNCQVKLFKDINYGGISVGPSSSSGYVGDAMNDEASSVQLN